MIYDSLFICYFNLFIPFCRGAKLLLQYNSRTTRAICSNNDWFILHECLTITGYFQKCITKLFILKKKWAKAHALLFQLHWTHNGKELWYLSLCVHLLSNLKMETHSTYVCYSNCDYMDLLAHTSCTGLRKMNGNWQHQNCDQRLDTDSAINHFVCTGYSLYIYCIKFNLNNYFEHIYIEYDMVRRTSVWSNRTNNKTINNNNKQLAKLCETAQFDIHDTESSRPNEQFV